jgi:hypothetical protein
LEKAVDEIEENKDVAEHDDSSGIYAMVSNERLSNYPPDLYFRRRVGGETREEEALWEEEARSGLRNTPGATHTT